MPGGAFEFISEVELCFGPLIGRERGEKVVGRFAHALHEFVGGVAGWLVGMHVVAFLIVGVGNQLSDLFQPW